MKVLYIYQAKNQDMNTIIERAENDWLFKGFAINAGFSASTGFVALLTPAYIADWPGWSRPEVPGPMASAVAAGVGTALVLFAARLGYLAWKGRVTALEARGIVAADLAWVTCTAGVLILRPDVLTGAGQWLLGALGLFVLSLAELKGFALRRRARDVTVGTA
jgi:hypothetical protein